MQSVIVTEEGIEQIDLHYYDYFGVVTLPSITTSIVNQTVTISGNGVFNFASGNDSEGLMNKYQIPLTDETIFSINSEGIYYIYASYNSGNPIYLLTQDPNIFLNNALYIPVFRIVLDNDQYYILNYDEYGKALAEKLLYKDVILNTFKRLSGIILSETATRIVNVSNGSTTFGVSYYTTPAMISDIAPTLMYEYKHDSSNWWRTSVTQYNNLDYDNGTNLVTMEPNRYSCRYFYIDASGLPEIYYTMGDRYLTLSAAKAEKRPTPPSTISSHSIFIGRIIIQKSATSGVVEDYTIDGPLSSPISHNDTLNRDAVDCHPMSSITGLTEMLDGIETLLAGI